ncbi:hypothetical protein [Mesorhizobium sp.]|uniref:hypothetical protein n=1 Tax=Mesorhizobium sp. TaxID=1871066 RepID=UPI001210F084|nr:hypothetical protein [Mesorhizobium sp.]TJV16707.1 MAG: hypothetical protein E5Y07_15740 [Mesorhizobium sp.]
MAEERIKNIVEYKKLANIRLKSGFIFKSVRDPSEDVESEIKAYLESQRASFNQRVESTFDLPEGEYTKFEFFWTPQRAKRVAADDDRIEQDKVWFRSQAKISLLYLKLRYLIIFKTEFKFAVTEAGCGGNGAIYSTGGRNFTLEEIYFNKITTVGAYHDEELYNVINPGCSGENKSTFNVTEDGFVIRAGEAFRITASQSFAQELRDARNMINGKISGVN